MNLKRKCLGGGYLRYRHPDEVPRQLSITRQKITDLSHSEDWGHPRQRAAVRRLAQPLKRFLNRQIGRPWVEVQEELDVRWRQIQAPKEMREYVRVRVFRQVVSASEWAANLRKGPYWTGWSDGTLFVDPATGRLRQHRSGG